MESLGGRLARARARLTAAGIGSDEAAIDVSLYARTLMSWDRAKLLQEQGEPVPSGLEPRFSEWIERRTRFEPSAYIVGVREFYGRDFRVTPAVLIPRPETELIVEEALVCVAQTAGPAVADIGTGSGCLAVTITAERADAQVVATDVSAGALEVAAENARRLGVLARVRFVRTSYLDGVAGPFDLVIANPPYVKDGDRPGLARPVHHEPAEALFGGTDGLRDIAGVLDAAAARLRTGGHLVLEFGLGQDDAVAMLIRTRPALLLERVRTDLQGIPRTAVIRRL